MRASCSTTRSTAWPSGRFCLRGLGIAVLAVLLSVPSPSQDRDNPDLRLFRLINGSQLADRDGFFEILDHTTLPLFAVVPGAFLAHGLSADHRSALTTCLMLSLAELGSLGGTLLLKEIVRRPRPFESLADVRVKHRWSAGGYAFPSGHTSGAFSIAAMLALRYPRLTVIAPVVTWGILVGYSRIYLGVHYPSDILGGAVVGTVTAILVWQFRSDLDRLSGRMVGPSVRSLPPVGGLVARTDLVRFSIPFD